jgi:hypothetical protein
MGSPHRGAALPAQVRILVTYFEVPRYLPECRACPSHFDEVRFLPVGSVVTYYFEDLRSLLKCSNLKYHFDELQYLPKCFHTLFQRAPVICPSSACRMLTSKSVLAFRFTELCCVSYFLSWEDSQSAYRCEFFLAAPPEGFPGGLCGCNPVDVPIIRSLVPAIWLPASYNVRSKPYVLPVLPYQTLVDQTGANQLCRNFGESDGSESSTERP